MRPVHINRNEFFVLGADWEKRMPVNTATREQATPRIKKVLPQSYSKFRIQLVQISAKSLCAKSNGHILATVVNDRRPQMLLGQQSIDRHEYCIRITVRNN